MSPLPLGLIQMLGSAAASALRSQNNAPAEGVSFEEMLELARSGEISTGEGVSIDPAVGIELSADQASRLSKAADRALAAGATDVIVMLDGMALRLDVHNRQITERVNLEDHGELLNIDGIISAAPDSSNEGQVTGPVTGPGTLAMNASLMNALAQSKRAG